MVVVFFRVFRKLLCRNELLFWYFLGSTYFSYRVNIKVSEKLSVNWKKFSSNCDQDVQLNDFYLPVGFYRAFLVEDG